MKEKSNYSWLDYLQNPVVIFLIKGLALFLIWDLIVYRLLISDSFHNLIINYLVDSAAVVLQWFYPNAKGINAELYVNGIHSVHVGIPCNGIEAMGVFSCIAMAFNAKWYHKVWIMLVSYLFIFILNVLRISALAILVITHNKDVVDISHKYVFNVLLYVALLILFWLWSSRFGKKAES